MTDVGRHAIGDPRAELNERRSREQAFLEQLVHEPQIARIEDFQFRLDPEVAQNTCAFAQVVRGGNVGAIAVAEVECAAVEGRDVGPIQSLVA